MKRLGRTASVLLLVALTASTGHAADVIWVSRGTGTWSTTTNWHTGAVPGASDNVLFKGWAPLVRTSWTMGASHTFGGFPASNMKDGRESTRWASGLNQASGQYVTVNLGSAQTFAGISMSSQIATDYARAFDVYVSSDGVWDTETAIASGTGSSARVEVKFSEQTFQHIKIQLTTSASNWWNIGELLVWGTGGATKLYVAGATVTGTGPLAGTSFAGAVDGDYTTRWAPAASQVSGQYVCLDLGSTQTVSGLILDAYSGTDQYPSSYSIQVGSTACQLGTTVASGSPTVEYVHVTFTATAGRYVTITQSNTDADPWSIYELSVLGTPANVSTPSSQTLTAIKQNNGVTFTQASGHTITLTGDWNQSAGTFTGGNSQISIGGDFIYSGGTFTSTTGLLQIGGAFNNTAGNFAPSSGSVLLTSTGTETLATGGDSFNHLYINDGLVAYWPFEETSGPSLDSSGWGRSATWSTNLNDDPTHATTNFTNDRSLKFVATNNDYATFTPPDVTATTVAAWVYSLSRPNDFNRIMETAAFQISFADSTQTAPQVADAVAWTVVTDGVDHSWRTPASSIADNAWYHIAVTYDGASTGKVYINGVNQTLTTIGTATGTIVPNDVGTGYIGNRSDVLRDWNGYIDDMRIYNRALSAAEIADIYGGAQRTAPVGTQTLSGTLTTVGNLVLASGTLDVSATACSAAPCGVTVGGSWHNLGGAFTPRTGTVTFSGGSGGDVRSDRNHFYSLTIAEADTWTLRDRLYVDNTLTMSAGTLDQSTSNYDIHAGTLNKTTGTLSGSGDVVLDAASAKTLIVNSMAPNLRIESPRDNGLVGYWKLDEGRGTVAYDLSGNGNNGTLTNSPIWSTDVSSSMPIDDAGSVDFNGTSQYVSIGDPAVLDFTGQITLAAWVKPTSTSGTQNIVAHGHGTSPNAEVVLRIASGVYDAGSYNGTTYSTSYAVPGGDLGNWVHLAGVYDGTHWRLYRNGIEVSSAVKAVGSVTVAENWAIGARSTGGERWFDGKVDDVRIYNRGLSANEVAALYSYGYTTGSTVVYSLGATSAVSGTLKIDSGILDAATFQNSITGATTINGGEYRIGSNTNGQTFTGGLTVNRYGDLTLASAGGKAILGNNTTLVMNGTLTASSATAAIQAVTSGRYTFNVGTTSTATPTLNITGLQVKDTTANGMYINTDTASVTTFTRFDNIAFSNGNGTGAGNYNLRIYSTGLNLASNGCTFDSGVAKTVEKNVFLAGNGSDGDSTETRAIFGGSTCASSVTCESYDGDDDNNATPDGVGDTPASNGAVVQWIQSAYADTAGSIEGFPTAAFDWSNFTYYATYVAYKDTSGTVDTVYVRNASGTALYSWSTSSGEDIIGTPRWDSTGPGGARVHHVYVATTGGKVYHLIDGGSSLIPDTASPWDGANNPYNCSCVITTPLAQDSATLYFGGHVSNTHKLWTLSKTSASPRLAGNQPLNTTTTTNNTAPAIWTTGGLNYAFLGLSGRVTKIDTSNQAHAADNTNPVGYAVTGRITIVFNKLYAGDDNGTIWSLDPDTNFGASSGTHKFWSYKDSAHAAGAPAAPIKSHYFDPLNARVYFGDQDGHIYIINSTGGTVLNPWRPGTTSDAFATAPFYQSGVIVAGTTTGTLYVIDANSNGTVPAKIQTYQFGASNLVSGVGYDPITSRYMVSTANATNKDGKLYYIAAVGDPTTAFP